MTSSDARPPDQGAAATWRRRAPGVGWLIALVTIPLLLAAIDWGARTTAAGGGPEFAPPSVNASASLTVAPRPAAPAAAPPPAAVGFGPMTITRTVRGFSVVGELPDEKQKQSLVTSLRSAMPGADIADRIADVPGARAPEFGGLGALFAAAIDIPQFQAAQTGGTTTLTGRATDDDDRAAAEAAAGRTWPGTRIVNHITVG